MPERVSDTQPQHIRAPSRISSVRDESQTADSLTGSGGRILSLQRMIGNRAAAHLLSPTAVVQREGEEERQAETGTTEAVLPPGSSSAGDAATNTASETASQSGSAPGTTTNPAGAEGAAAENAAPVERYTEADRTVLDAATAEDGVIGAYQAGLVPRALNHLTQPAYEMFRSIISNAGSDLERAYLFKALAAGRNMADITTFAGRIQGRSERWLRRNLTLVNTAGGGGVTQQYSDSCAPTTQQALRGQFDPIYALELRSSGNIAQQTPNALTDPTSLANRREAREQRSLLTSGGGALADRATGGGAGVSDTNYRQLVNRLASTTGISYRPRYIPGDLSWNQAFWRMNRALDRGISLPAGVTSPPPSSGGHAVLLTRHEGNRYQIHDPWTGQTVWKTRNDFRNNTLNLPSGWNQMDMIMVPVELDLRRLQPDASAPAAPTGE